MNFPIGKIRVCGDNSAVTNVEILTVDKDNYAPFGNSAVASLAEKEFTEYFAGKRTNFTFPIKLHGTDFQQLVWRHLQKIPFGETRSYKQIAELMNRPTAIRAVAGACARNPLHIVVPCHRVIASNNALCGFAAGVDAKRFLLNLEKCAK